MKAIVIILTAILLTGTTAFAKKNAGVVEDTRYGIGFSEVNNGSGHGVGYAFNANLMKGRKSLEVGLIYSDKESKFAGGDIKYKIYLGNLFRIQDNGKLYKPYIQYNLMYQKGTSFSPDVVTLGGETYEVPTEPGIVATFGNYLAYGNKIKLFGNTYLDSSLGVGYYFGSLDKVNGPGTLGVHGTNGGLTFSFKVGVGYTFN